MAKRACLIACTINGPRGTVTTKTDESPEAVWAALIDFTENRPKLWPMVDPTLYDVHDVRPGFAEVTEGTDMGPGMKIWFRERYEWTAGAMELRSTTLESNVFVPGGTSRWVVTPTDGGGTILEETFDRPRRGLLAGVRGAEKLPGEFRRTPVWVGSPTDSPDTATYVPPLPADLPDLIKDWEEFVNPPSDLPP